MTVVTWSEDVDLTNSNLPERLQKCPGPVIVTQASEPFEIVACNSAWSKLCGFQPEDALGKDPSILQGPQTNHKKAKHFAAELLREGHAASTLVNYTKFGRPFVHRLNASAIVDSVSGKKYFVTESREERRASIRNVLLSPRSNLTYNCVHLVLAVLCVIATVCVASFASDEHRQFRPLASERTFMDFQTEARVYPSYTYGDIYF